MSNIDFDIIRYDYTIGIFWLKFIFFCSLHFQMDLRSLIEKIVQWLADSDTESLPDDQHQSSESEGDNNFETEIHINTDESEENAAVSSDDEFFVPRRGRNRRLILDSDDDTSLTSCIGHMDSEHERLHQQPSHSAIIHPSGNNLYGKNQH